MKKIASIVIDTDFLIEEITSPQAETLIGGYCQSNDDYPSGYIINITRFKKNPPTQPQTPKPNNFSGQKINSIDNSRKIYINGVPIPGERNIIIIY